MLSNILSIPSTISVILFLTIFTFENVMGSTKGSYANCHKWNRGDHNKPGSATCNGISYGHCTNSNNGFDLVGRAEDCVFYNGLRSQSLKVTGPIECYSYTTYGSGNSRDYSCTTYGEDITYDCKKLVQYIRCYP